MIECQVKSSAPWPGDAAVQVQTLVVTNAVIRKNKVTELSTTLRMLKLVVCESARLSVWCR